MFQPVQRDFNKKNEKMDIPEDIKEFMEKINKIHENSMEHIQFQTELMNNIVQAQDLFKSHMPGSDIAKFDEKIESQRTHLQHVQKQIDEIKEKIQAEKDVIQTQEEQLKMIAKRMDKVQQRKAKVETLKKKMFVLKQLTGVHFTPNPKIVSGYVSSQTGAVEPFNFENVDNKEEITKKMWELIEKANLNEPEQK